MLEPKLKQKQNEVTYYKLNNELNRPVNGSIPLGKDKEAVKAYFLEHVNPNTVFFYTLDEKLDYLIENNYIEKDFLNKYTRDFVKEVFQKLYNHKFRFKSFMSAYKFYTQYSLKTDDGSRYLERYEDRIAFNALYLADGDCKLAINLADEMINQRYQPATPTFLNAGRKRRGEFVSCFLIQPTDDMNSIGRTINSALQLSRIGGGVGVGLSNIRASGDPIKKIENASSGVVPVMKLLEDSFSYSNQLGQRNGAGAVYLNVFHPDVVSFLSTKKENADEKIRVKTLSLGLTVPDKFYELCATDQDMYLFSPYDVERFYGKPFSYVNITEEYENMVNNPNINKSKVKARDLENEISKLQQESGYPYILNIDTTNKENPVYGTITMSNLCVTGDTELLTNQGYITAKELYDTQENLNITIDRRTMEFNALDKGVEQVKAIPMHLTAKNADIYELVTRQGFSIKSTAWHKYYVKRDDVIIKIPMNEINIGDRVLVQSGEGSRFGSNDDKELAYIMGVTTGDGTLSYSRKGLPNARIILHQDKVELREEIEDAVAKIIERYLPDRTLKHNANLYPHFVEKEQAGKTFLSMNSFLLGEVLNGFGFNKESKLELPRYIKNGTKEVQQKYLSGLFQMDGCVNANQKYKSMSVELVTISKTLARGIQKIILNLGVYSSIYTRDKRIAFLPDSNRDMVETKCRATYRVTIQDRNSRETFAEIVELKSKDVEKMKEFNKTLSKKSRRPKHDYTAEVVSISHVGKEDVYDTTQKDYSSLIFNGIVTGNCSEILQVQEVSEINDDQTYKTLGTDISCNLGSTNIPNLLKSNDFEKSVDTMVRALTFVTNTSSIDSVPSIKNGNDKAHTIGLGAMGLHTAFAMNQIMYGSPESIELTDAYFLALNYYTLLSSNQIARQRNESFYNFDKSDYYSGKYFDRYTEEEFSFKHEKVAKIFENIDIPSTWDWLRLKEDVRLYGLYHQNRLAIAPTGSISYVNETSASLHPITRLIEERQEKKTGKTYYPAPHLSNETLPYYKSAYDIDMRRVIDVYATAQRHIDQGMSLTLFMRSEIEEGMYEWKNGRTNKLTTRDLNILRNYAWRNGIKTIYYVRTFTDNSEEIGSNECENCSI